MKFKYVIKTTTLSVLCLMLFITSFSSVFAQVPSTGVNTSCTYASQDIYDTEKKITTTFRWDFAGTHTCGRFANGEAWVVGPVTITQISPATSGNQSGSMVNPVMGQNGFDGSDARGKYNAALNIGLSLPKQISSGSSVVSTKSGSLGAGAFDSLAVLTVLDAVPAQGSFRPSWYGSTNKRAADLHNVSDLNFNVFADLAPTPSSKSPADQVAEGKMKYILLDYLFDDGGASFSTDFHAETLTHHYGREISKESYESGLALNLNYSDADKRELLIQVVQRGIDTYGAYTDSVRPTVVEADGGHRMGRLINVFIAAKALGDSAMMNLAKFEPDGDFQEDQTFRYVTQDYISKATGYSSADIGMAEWCSEAYDRMDRCDKAMTSGYRHMNAQNGAGVYLVVKFMNGLDELAHYPMYDYAKNRFWGNSINPDVGTANGISRFAYEMWQAHHGGTTAPSVTVPTISPSATTSVLPVNVSITTTTSGASIYYTTNGSNPTTSSTLYTGPFTLSSTATVKAIAVKSGMTSSGVQSRTYTISSGPSLPVNTAPVVSAGPDLTVTLPSTASLDATVTDDGLPSGSLSYSWTKVSGTGTVTFTNAGSVDTTASFSTAGTYVLRLTASDGSLSASDDVKVTVTTATSPTTRSLQVTKTGTGTGIVSGTGINCGSDCAETFSSNTTVSLSATPSTGSVFAGWTGSCSGTGSCSVMVDGVKTVGALFNTATVAPGSWPAGTRVEVVKSINVRREAILTATKLDTTTLIGTNPVGTKGTVEAGPVRNVAVDWYKVNFDSGLDGWVGKDNLVQIAGSGNTPANQSPTVNAGPDLTVTLPSTASLDATVTDDGLPSGSLSYSWTKVSGTGTVTFTNAGSVDTTASFSTAGTYVLRLTASDGSLSASDDVKVTVNAAVVIPGSWPAGTRVEVVKSINVRREAILTATKLDTTTLIGTNPVGTKGTVEAGPVRNVAVDWYKVNFDSGLDGWVGKDNLVQIAGSGETAGNQTPTTDSGQGGTVVPAEPTGSIRYVRSGATGNGSDWTNALPTLPADMQRGITYYVADGSYDAYEFNDAKSGTQMITVKKATGSDHGTNTGWQSSYGDGVAEFAKMTIKNTGYITIDGGAKSGAKGLLIKSQNGSLIPLDIESSDHLYIMNIEVNGDFSAKKTCMGTRIADSNYITMKNNFIHNVGDDGLTILTQNAATDYRTHNILFEGNHVASLYGSDSSKGGSCNNGHSDALELREIRDAVFNRNYFYNIPSTSAFLPANHKSSDSSLMPLRNIIFSNNIVHTPEAGVGTYLNYMYDSKVFNNTIWHANGASVWLEPELIDSSMSNETTGAPLKNFVFKNNILGTFGVNEQSEFAANNIDSNYNFIGSFDSLSQTTAYVPNTNDIYLHAQGYLRNNTFTTPVFANNDLNVVFSGSKTDSRRIVNPGTDSFKLHASSPVINAGTDSVPKTVTVNDTVVDLSLDFFGNPRSGAYDMGAIEYGSVSSSQNGGSTLAGNTSKYNSGMGLVLSRNLEVGTEGEDVRQLQVFLNKNGYFVSESGEGSLGNETTYFGQKTADAVKRFQRANGLPGTGAFYEMSRAAASSIR